MSLNVHFMRKDGISIKPVRPLSERRRVIKVEGLKECRAFSIIILPIPELDNDWYHVQPTSYIMPV